MFLSAHDQYIIWNLYGLKLYLLVLENKIEQKKKKNVSISFRNLTKPAYYSRTLLNQNSVF